MNSWWDLGEGIGQRGTELAIYQIECPFCDQRGNFSTEHHAQKKKSNSDKLLNFDTLKCGNCSGYVMVLWSASEHSYGHNGLHEYKVLPYPLKINSAPDHWPVGVKRSWIQAHRNLEDGNWDAASIMARTAMESALLDHQATGKNLKENVNDLGTKKQLPPLMIDWSHEVRLLGNEGTHADPDSEGISSEDARDIVEYLDYLLEYLYDLPKRITVYRGRKKQV